MTLKNAKVLHKQLLEVGRIADAKDIERRFPELAIKEEPVKEEPKPEVKKVGKVRKR